MGAEVDGVDLGADLGSTSVDEVRRALVEHKVLVFRRQSVDDERQVALTRALGGATAAHPVVDGLPDSPAILRTELSADRTDRGEAEIDPIDPFGGSVERRLRTEWHIDNTFVANPTSISILRGVHVPPAGGDTLFADLQSLYESLSSSLRSYLDTLQIVHSRFDRAPPARRDGKPSGPFSALHPLVSVHPETGSRSLLISSVFMQAIPGLKPRESAALLNLLLDEMAGRDEIHVRVRWEQDSLVMWDNRAVAHAGPVDGHLFTDERIVHRTTVAGPVLRGPDGFVSRSLIGEMFEAID